MRRWVDLGVVNPSRFATPNRTDGSLVNSSQSLLEQRLLLRIQALGDELQG